MLFRSTGGEKLDLVPKCKTESCGTAMRFVSSDYNAFKDWKEVWWVCDTCGSKIYTPYPSVDLAASPILANELKRLEDQEKLRLAIEEKRKAEAQGEEASKRALAAKYRRDGLPKELREQLASGKIPPMPGDELTTEEWMRRREGRPAAAEERQAQKMKEEQRQADAILQELKRRSEPSQRPFLMMPKLTPDLPKKRAAKPDKTTEEAQEELTGLGRRKIITGDDK